VVTGRSVETFGIIPQLRPGSCLPMERIFTYDSDAVIIGTETGHATIISRSPSAAAGCQAARTLGNLRPLDSVEAR
jgi:hypothetical protein